MPTGYEVKMYADLARIADSLEKIQKDLAKLAKAAESGA